MIDPKSQRTGDIIAIVFLVAVLCGVSYAFSTFEVNPTEVTIHE